MTTAELEAALAKSNEALSKSLGEVLAKALKPPEQTAEQTAEQKAAADGAASKAATEPLFKGDPTNAAEVKKHLDALAKAKLAKGVDWTDLDAVEKYHKELAAATGGDKGDKSPEVLRLEKELAEARKASNAGDGKGGDDSATAEHYVGMAKEDQVAGSIGVRMAKFANAQRGIK